MYKLAVTTTFFWALTAIASALIANEVSGLTAVTSILMTTCVTELALYIGEA